MDLINLTPHPVNYMDEDNQVIFTLEKCENPPRLSQETIKLESIQFDKHLVNVTGTKFGETQNLPESKDGVYLVVSRLVLSANPERQDLLVPNDIVRNEKGHIIGCKSFAKS